MLFDNDLTFLSFVNMVDDKTNTSENKQLVSCTEGFIKGNMFEDEYVPYKNLKPSMPKTTCEKTARLYHIMELEFAINDINLYLDIHPKDEKCFEILKKYIEKLCECEKEYVKKYGPLEITENISKVNEWVKNYPWEREDSLYV